MKKGMRIKCCKLPAINAKTFYCVCGKYYFEEKEWNEGIEQHYDKGGGDYECANCDWATNDKEKADRHREFYDHKLWSSLIKMIRK